MSKKYFDAESEQAAAYNKAMGVNSNIEGVADGNINNPGTLPEKKIFPWEKKVKVSPLDKLKNLSATSRVNEMKNQLKSDVYVFDGLALEGQITLFFAWPNTGKTLLFIHMLIEGIKTGAIKAEDIFYINADDDFRGLVTKSEIAKKYGFQMISPDESGLTSSEIIQILLDVADQENAGGKIIILDTVKKFVNLMNKAEQSSFYSTLRMLSVKRITVILAGHANKYSNADDELVYEGTADTLNDVDCVYSINRMSQLDSDEMVVEFRNIKNRGDVLKKRSYKYNNRAEISWTDRLASVKLLNEKAAGAAKYKKVIQDKMDKYASQLLFVSALLKTHSMNQSEIMKKHTEYRQNPEDDLHPLASEISVRNLQTGLEKLTDIVWRVTRDTGNNAKVFRLIDADGSQYKKAKHGT